MSLVELIGFFISLIAMTILFFRNKPVKVDLSEPEFEEEISRENPLEQFLKSINQGAVTEVPKRPPIVPHAVTPPKKSKKKTLSNLENYRLESDLEDYRLKTKLTDYRPKSPIAGRRIESELTDKYEQHADTRSALIDRFLEDAVEVDVDALRDRDRRRASSAASWSTSRRPACTRATPRARSRRRRCRPTCSRRSRRTPRALADALDVVGLLNVQYAVQGRAGLRHRGEPAREPHRAVREQGDRRAARQGRGPAHGRRDVRRAPRRRAAAAAGRRAVTSR